MDETTDLLIRLVEAHAALDRERRDHAATRASLAAARAQVEALEHDVASAQRSAEGARQEGYAAGRSAVLREQARALMRANRPRVVDGLTYEREPLPAYLDEAA